MAEARNSAGSLRAKRWPAVGLCLFAALTGAALLAGGRGGGHVSAAEPVDLEGRAWIMKGIAYNTQQPVLHEVVLPPGGENVTQLYYNFNASYQLVLAADSSRVSCNSTGNLPGSQSAHASCDVLLEGFGMWVGPYKIIEADRIRVASSSNSSPSGAESYPSIQIEGVCVYIEQEYAGGCVALGPGESVTFDRPPISGTVTRGGTDELFVSSGGQLGEGSTATALHVNLFNADYTTSTGIGSVVLDIAYAESFAGEPPPTPTPTRTPTPTKTPTPIATPETFQAVVPVLSRDE